MRLRAIPAGPPRPTQLLRSACASIRAGGPLTPSVAEYREEVTGVGREILPRDAALTGHDRHRHGPARAMHVEIPGDPAAVDVQLDRPSHAGREEVARQ